MKLYTRTGDKGKTSIIGGRVNKDDPRVEAYGTVDEVNGFVGLAAAELEGEKFADILADLEKIQHELFDLGGDLANITKKHVPKLTEEMVQYLEKRIDALTDEAPKLERFILPGGTKGAAALHIARSVSRRAERLTVRLSRENGDVSPVILQYLNRLSDYFFAAARAVNFRLNVKDVEYDRSSQVFKTRQRKEVEENEREEN